MSGPMVAPDLLPNPRIGDVMGEACRECWNDGRGLKPVTEVVEFRGGEVVIGDVRRYFEGREAWPATVHWALCHARGDVLDIGTGAGRFALDLQSHPAVSTVVGLDSSPGALEVAAFRGLTRTVLAEVGAYSGDPAGFDTLLLAGNNLGLLGSRAAAPAMLATLARLSRAGGRLIGFAGNPDHLPESVRRSNEDRGELPGSFVCRLRYRGIATDWFPYLFLSEDELVDLVADSAWEITDVRHGVDGLAVVLSRR